MPLLDRETSPCPGQGSTPSASRRGRCGHSSPIAPLHYATELTPPLGTLVHWARCASLTSLRAPRAPGRAPSPPIPLWSLRCPHRFRAPLRGTRGESEGDEAGQKVCSVVRNMYGLYHRRPTPIVPQRERAIGFTLITCSLRHQLREQRSSLPRSG